MLKIQHLTKTYLGKNGPIAVLTDVSVDVASGEFVAVQGSSGCGKTTLLLAAGGMLRPDSGTVHVAGEDVYELPLEQRAAFRAKNIGFVFQQFHLIPYLTVFDNVLSPSLTQALPNADQRADELIQRFGIDHRRSHVPGELSTGERQRAALARALLPRPGLILADEPTGNLDERNAEIVLNHLKEYTNDGGAVLLVTHSTQAAETAQRVVRLESPPSTAITGEIAS